MKIVLEIDVLEIKEAITFRGLVEKAQSIANRLSQEVVLKIGAVFPNVPPEVIIRRDYDISVDEILRGCESLFGLKADTNVLSI